MKVLPKFLQELDFVDLVLLVILVFTLSGAVPDKVMPQATEWTGG